MSCVERSCFMRHDVLISSNK